ncbi:MAG: lasso peptide biosynthesis B2 protein [Methanobacterium paludis]|nr:lasso peptide biosynthesis B2 protein [Methanobacterium paludis]
MNVAGEYVPRSTCLSKAMAAQILLSRHNYPSKLKIGVIKENEFEAHAWVEVDNEVVVGESKRDYVPILDLDVEQ